MQKNKVISASLAFIISFLFSQIATVLVIVFALIFGKLFSIQSNTIYIFFDTAFGYLILTLCLDLALVIVALFFNKHIKEEKPQTNNENVAKETNQTQTNNKKNKLNFKKVALYILLAVCAFILLYPIVNSVDILLIKLGFKPTALPYQLDTKGFIISLFSLVILPAICEEILFRGVIFKGFKQYGKIFSITLSTLAFAIFHMSIFQTVYPILMGLLLAGIMYREDNILYCIIVHGVSNLIALLVAYFGINLVFYNAIYYILAVLLLALFVTFLSFYIKKTKIQSKTKLKKEEIITIVVVFIIMIILWIILNIIR